MGSAKGVIHMHRTLIHHSPLGLYLLLGAFLASTSTSLLAQGATNQVLVFYGQVTDIKGAKVNDLTFELARIWGDSRKCSVQLPYLRKTPGVYVSYMESVTSPEAVVREGDIFVIMNPMQRVGKMSRRVRLKPALRRISKGEAASGFVNLDLTLAPLK